MRVIRFEAASSLISTHQIAVYIRIFLLKNHNNIRCRREVNCIQLSSRFSRSRPSKTHKYHISVSRGEKSGEVWLVWLDKVGL